MIFPVKITVISPHKQYNVRPYTLHDVLDTLTVIKGQILGLIEADMLLMGKEADFPSNLEPGRLLNVDGREMLVANSGKDLGLVEVALRQNRTG